VYVPQNENDNYAIEYSRFVVPLVKAVQELDAKTEEIKQLKNDIETIKNVLTPEQKSKLAGNNVVDTKTGLYQNKPNPFTEKTLIGYYIPQDIANAVIKIYSPAGAEVKSINIQAKGYCEVELKAGTLAPGNYTYTLVSDNTVIDTKTMTVTK
jgi:uncharacterized protein YlaI